MVNTAMGSGPRYAPPDPTLPPPWRALVDGNTGYIYYWNPETNVTQYEKPLHPQAPPLPAGPPPTSTAASGPKLASLPSVASTVANDAQNGRSIDGHGETPNGSLHRNSGGGFHGNNTKTGSYPGGNLHGSNVGNVQGNTGTNVHGNMSAKVFGTVAGPVHGIVSGTAVRSANGSTQGPTPATMHGNVRGTSFGSVSGPSHGSGSGPSHASVNGPSHGNAGGAIRGSSGSNLQSGSGGNLHGGNVPGSTGGSASGHPKLAAIPVSRGQQVIGGMHMTPHSAVTHATGVGPGPSSVSGSGSVAAYNKRSSNEYGFSDPDEYKRPRTQGYSGPPAASEIEAYKRQHEVTALGDNVPAPFMTFEAAGFPSEIMRELQAAGFTSPTPIQAQSWPIALQGRNVVAIAKTGSGKTLGYLLPAFIHLARHRNNSQLGPTVLVLAPTRELATQIQDEAVKFGRSSRIMSTCVYGGAPKGPQLRDIERGADIVIATPGRLNDFLEVKKVSLRQVSYLVLDEADRMLDMGFEPQIRKIVNEIPPRRQTLMYTATWPKEVRKIANDLMVNPVQVNIGNADELNANKSITQNVEMIPPYEKQRRLEQILRSQEPGSKIIIFCSTKKMCDQLARSLGRNFGAVAIHGDKSQNERDHVLSQFKCGRSPILVATDVAARGLDIKDIRVVINFDFPTGVEDYVHRIGRTGRAGATGVSYTFFSEQDGKYAKELVKVLEGASQKVPVELRDMASRTSHLKGRPGRWDTAGRGGRDGGRSSYGGGRGDGFGGRGIWNPAVQFDRRDRSYDRFGDRERFVDRGGGRNRYPNDRYHNRDSFKRFDDRDRGRSYSRSPSPSWSRGYSRSRSPSRSRSRSRSYDRFSDDRTQRSPYRKGHHGRSRSPYRRSLSPYQDGSPHRRNPTRNAYVSSHQSGPPIKAEPHESHSPHRAVPIETSSTKAAPIEAGSPHKVALKENSSPHNSAPIEIGSPRKASLCRRGLPQGNASPSWSKSLPRMAMSPLRSHSPPRRLYAPYESSPSPQRGDKTYQSEPPSFRDGSPHQRRSLGSLSLPRRGPSPTGSGSPSHRGALPSQGGLLPSSSPARGASSHQTGSPSSRSSPAHQDEMHASLSSPYQCVSPSCNDTVPCQDGLSGNLSSPHPVVSPNQNGLPFQKGITPYSSGSPPKNILPH